MQSILLILASCLVFSFFHSLLANRQLKQYFYDRGLTAQHYRLLYVLIAVISTALWLAYIKTLPDQSLYALQGIYRWLCYLIQGFALYAFYLSLRPIDSLAFLGLRPFKNNTEAFIEKGLYRYIRHPMYSSLIVLMFALPTQTMNSLALYTLISCYFIIGSRFEEQRMIKDHPEYADYRNRVPPFIPLLLPKLERE